MNISKLQSLGWSNYFFQQLSDDEISNLNHTIIPFRIIAIHRNHVIAISELGEKPLIIPKYYQPISQYLAVGDWVIAAPTYEHFKLIGLLDPKNKIERISNNVKQVMVANIDYLWVVTSANDEFNIKRLQRYIALALESNIEPVIILTKTDLCADVNPYLDKLTQLNIYNVHCVNIAEHSSYNPLDVYFKAGISIALVGSSGVGKSTLINSVSGKSLKTNSIRLDDAKGKHTTTHRALFYGKNQVAIIDTPGMRELQLLDAQSGI